MSEVKAWMRDAAGDICECVIDGLIDSGAINSGSANGCKSIIVDIRELIALAIEKHAPSCECERLRENIRGWVRAYADTEMDIANLRARIAELEAAASDK